MIFALVLFALGLTKQLETDGEEPGPSPWACWTMHTPFLVPPAFLKPTTLKSLLPWYSAITQMLFPVCRPPCHLHWSRFFMSASPLNHKQFEGNLWYTLVNLLLQNLAVPTTWWVLNKGYVNKQKSTVQMAECGVKSKKELENGKNRKHWSWKEYYMAGKKIIHKAKLAFVFS